MQPKLTQRITLRLPERLDRQLRAQAHRLARSVNWLCLHYIAAGRRRARKRKP